MAKYIINGDKKLQGRVRISGNKNAVFPCLAAALLTEEEVVLKNIPQISDTSITLEIISALGAVVSQSGETITVRADKIKTSVLPAELLRKLRGAALLASSVVSRTGSAEFIHPGGDVIGKRGMEIHMEGLHAMGFQYEMDDLSYRLHGNKSSKSIEYFLPLASVTATEMLILAAVLGEGEVTLKNCAKEPHVVDLCQMLNQMGAKISGIGEGRLLITGVKSLHGTEYSIGADYLEAGAYAIAAVITHGQITIENFTMKDMEPVLLPLIRMGIVFKEVEGGVEVSGEELAAMDKPKLITNFWPGFPTDMVSVLIVLATQAEGVSLIHDWVFESRMFFVDKLIAMGAHITIADPHRVVVYGPTNLIGRELESPDIRAGMSLVLAALVAKGQSIINKAEHIERGYSNVVENLTSLGADIKRID